MFLILICVSTLLVTGSIHAQPKEVKLTFWTFVEKHADYMQLAVEEFNKANPDVKLGNNLLWPLVAMRSETRFPLTVGIASLVNQYRPRYDMVMAASTLATIPVIIVFLIMQRQFLEGLGAMGRMVEK